MGEAAGHCGTARGFAPPLPILSESRSSFDARVKFSPRTLRRCRDECDELGEAQRAAGAIDDSLVFGLQSRPNSRGETVEDRGCLEPGPELPSCLLLDSGDGGERCRPEQVPGLRYCEAGMGKPGPDLRHVLASRLHTRANRGEVA